MERFCSLEGKTSTDLVRRITNNTAAPFQQLDDPHEWIASFSGENMRWEVIGLLFSYVSPIVIELRRN